MTTGEGLRAARPFGTRPNEGPFTTGETERPWFMLLPPPAGETARSFDPPPSALDSPSSLLSRSADRPYTLSSFRLGLIGGGLPFAGPLVRAAGAGCGLG